MSLRLLAVAATLAAATAATPAVATACPAPPPGDPNYRCTKYDYLDRVPLPLPAPTRYVRERAAPLPRRLYRSAAMRVLTSSRWIARGGPGQPALRLFDGADAPETIDSTESNALIRGVTLRAGRFEVSINGQPYLLTRCKDDRGRKTACLEPVATPGP